MNGNTSRASTTHLPLAVSLVAAAAVTGCGQLTASSAIPMDADDIAGVVT